MIKRTSIVDKMNILSVSFASILEIGDSVSITPLSRALAVQREYQLFFEDEGNWDDFPIFSKTIPQPEMDEDIQINYYYENPVIKVHHIDITGASTSAVVQIGSTKKINSEARVKHIRQIAEEKYEQ